MLREFTQMSKKGQSATWLALLACLASNGCASIRDVSAIPEYRPWIGKTVAVVGAKDYNVFAPTWGPYFMDWLDSYCGYPVVAKVPVGYPVVITAVKRTEGKYLIGGPFIHDQLILSMADPSHVNKRITVCSEINSVEPFKDKNGHILLDLQHDAKE